MNKLKSIWLILIFAVTCAAFTNSLQAQDAPVTFGIRGGLNYSDFGGDVKNAKHAFKYQVGITADIAFNENIYILTALDLQTKGAKVKHAGETTKYNPMYLQIPVHIAYKFDVAKDIRLVVSAGPYAAYGIGGKVKDSDDKIDFFGKDKFKRFDFGLGAGIGVEFGKIALGVGYDIGLANISDVKDVKVRNRNGFVTLGYKF